jgi:hypothetical protein
MTRKKTTIIELAEVSVEHPLCDGARAFTDVLGFFSTYEKAVTFVRKKIAKEPDENDGGIVYYVLDGKVLDVPRLDSRADTTILDRDGSVRGVIRGEYEEPWGGRDPSSCKFKLGDLVGFVWGDIYKLGVVNGCPLTPEEAKGLGDMVTLGDDLYLIGVLGKDGSPETNDHEHIHECELFEVTHEVTAEMRAALKTRHRGYEE